MRGLSMDGGLTHPALLLFTSRILALGMNLATGILVARGLGPTGRGVYALAVLIPVLIAQIISLGLNTSAVYFTGQGRHPLPQIASTLFWVALILGSGTALLAGWGLRTWGQMLLGEFPPQLLPLALASLPFLLSVDFLGHVLLGQERTGAFALLGVVFSLVLLIAQGVGFLLARGRVEVALAGWFLAQIVAALCAITMIRKQIQLTRALHWGFLREAVRYSRAGYVTNWLQYMNLRLDQFLVNAWVGSAALGQYAVAVSLTEALWQLPASVSAVLFARVAGAGQSGKHVSTAQACRLTILVMLGLAVLMAVAARPLVTLLYGSAYAGSLPALYALLPGTVALVIPNVISGYMYGRGTPHYITYGSGIALLSTLVGDLLLIPLYGIVGAGLASSLAYGVYGGVMMVMAQHISGERWVHFLFPSRADWQWLWPGSRIGRVLAVIRLPEMSWRARLELLGLAFGKRLLPAKDYQVHLPYGQVYFAATSLTFDQRAFDEIFIERCYRTDYQDTTVIDVGAHKGYYGAYALLHGASAVLSYEPEKHNFAFLQRCADSFNCHGSKWHIFKSAVGSCARESTLHISDQSWAHTLLAFPNTQATNTEQVLVMPMSHLLEQARPLPGHRLVVKVDAEGAECDIILGTSADAWRVVDEMFVEMHAFAPCSLQEVIDHLESAGLTLWKENVGGVVHLMKRRS
ncbi:MAG: FkbM family methyltransferase [Anaerolineae bacterium]